MPSNRVRAALDRIQLFVASFRWGSADKTAKGVGGWLLVLIIILIFLEPLGILAGIASSNKIITALGERFPIYSRLEVTYDVFRLALLCISIYAGVSLWRIKSGAVSRGKGFLLLLVLLSLLRIAFPFVGDLPESIRSKFLSMDVMGFIRSFIVAAVWQQYLARSIRVKNTFCN
jgi:hypothetical protein